MGNTQKKEKLTVQLTPKEQQLLQESWHKHIHDHPDIGLRAFESMFAEAPEAREGFSNFADIDVNDEHYNEVLHRHGDRVKQSIGKMINGNESDMKHFLITLGHRHYKEYKFDPQYLPVLSNYFHSAIKEVMGSDWTSELDVAYSKLFKIVAFYMLRSMESNL